MTLSPANAQHIGAREQQQDSFGFSNFNDTAFVEHGGVVAVVADGMGGMAHGNAASQTAVRSFLSSYAAKLPQESIPQALDRALREANSAVANLARSAGLEDGMGTTLVAAAVHDGALYWISAGDSRVYLLRGGQVAKLTSDHIYANELREGMVQGKLSRAEALGNPQRADLTSYLGLDEVPEIDRNLRPFPIHAGESVILCTDGLYRGLKEDEMAAAFQGDPQAACEGLVQRVLGKRLPHQDNITVVALKCDSNGTPIRGSHTKIAVAVSSVFLVAALGLGGFWWWHVLHPAKGTGTNQVAQTQPTPNPRSAEPSTGAEQLPEEEPTAKTEGRPKTTGPKKTRVSVAATMPAPTPTHAPSPTPARTPENAVSLTPATIDFPDQPVATWSKAQGAVLKNEGAEPRSFNIALNGRDYTSFGLRGHFSCGTLEAGAICPLELLFYPRRAGKFEAELTITESSGRIFKVALTGTGVAAGSQPPPTGNGAASPAASNPDTAAKGQPPSQNPPATPQGEPVKAGTVKSPAGASAPAKTVPNGRNAIVPEVVILPEAGLDFKKLGLNQRSKPVLVSVTNTGDADVTIVNVTIAGKAAGDFTKNADACLLGPLAKSTSCMIEVVFAPQKGGKRSAVLNITDSTGSTHSVKLSGTGARSF